MVQNAVKKTAAAASKSKPSKSTSSKKPVKLMFKSGDFVVYPAHGVGEVIGVEKETIAGLDVEVYVVEFSQDKLILRVPTAKAKSASMRQLAGPDVIQNALKTLTGKARIKREMWSRRAQKYEEKINSGNLILLAEVVRDLHRTEEQPEQSYSERQLYEAALDRMAREVAAVEKIDHDEATMKLRENLAKKINIAA